MKRILKNTLFTLTALSLTGCATIMNGTKQPLGVTSNPSNANIWVDNYYVGQTPSIIQMSRDNDHIVRVELEGYYPYEIPVTRNISRWLAGNLLWGGPLGVVVDALTGGIYVLTPDQIQAQLRAGNIACCKNSKTSWVSVVLEADPSWRKVGQMTAKK